jgi:hypothetical protein
MKLLSNVLSKRNILFLLLVILFLLFLDISYPTINFVYKRITLSDKDLINDTFNLEDKNLLRYRILKVNPA